MLYDHRGRQHNNSCMSSYCNGCTEVDTEAPIPQIPAQVTARCVYRFKLIATREACPALYEDLDTTYYKAPSTELKASACARVVSHALMSVCRGLPVCNYTFQPVHVVGVWVGDTKGFAQARYLCVRCWGADTKHWLGK